MLLELFEDVIPLETPTTPLKKCIHCGVVLGYCMTTRKNYKTEYYLRKPYKLDGKEYFRDVCCDCFKKEFGVLPVAPNCIARNELIYLLHVPEESVNKKFSDRALTLENYIKKYGEAKGTALFNEYRNRQRLTNTFEYKAERYGWSEEEFKEYNLSRAVTLENQIKKYGIENGTKKFNEYKKKQAYAGVSLEYFIEKLGSIKLAKAELERINKEKSNTLDSFIRRYGVDIGKTKYEEMLVKRSKNMIYTVSKISTNLFDNIYNTVYNSDSEFVYYAKLNKEHVVYDNETKTPYFIDFVDISKKRAIEFQGTYWHLHPSIYDADYVNKLTGKSAKETWEYDAYRESVIRDAGYDILYVWEHEYMANPESVEMKCIDFLRGE